MSTESPRQPPFYCPACGKKHRADLSALQGRSGAVAKLACARCEAEITLRIGVDGLPKCEVIEPSGGPMSQPDVTKPRLLLPLATAAILAAAISFAVASAVQPASAPAKEDPRIGALQRQVETLALALQEARQQDAARHAAIDERLARMGSRIEGAETTVASLGQTVSAVEDGAAKISTAFLAIQTDHEDHGNRIEANRVTTRQLDKRLKALEGK